MEANARKIQQEQSTIFWNTLKELVANSGMQLYPNDEKALEQVINIARNTDGSVNEEVIAWLPQQFKALVRAWVMNGVGRTSFTPKVERIGGTTKSPVYWYRDPNQQRFVTTNAIGVPTGGTVRAWGGGGSGGWTGWDVAVSNQATDILNDPNLSKSVWGWSVLGNVPWTPQYDFQKKVDNYVNNLVLPKLKNLKGSTSDKDIAFIKAAATSLDTGMSEATFKKTLQDMWWVLNKYDSDGNPIWWKLQTKQTSTPTQPITAPKSNDPLWLR